MHPELVAEQEYLDRAHDHLQAMQATASRLADAFAVTARTDMNDAAVQHSMRRYRAALDLGQHTLCFGRIDEEHGDRWYVGRRHVEDDRGRPVVVDWRAGVATPFYRATFADPLGLERRRRFVLDGRNIVDLFDEDFADPDSAHGTSGIPDPLLAELDRSRTGTMRDIVATIQAEQDVVIRAPLDLAAGRPGRPRHRQDGRRPAPRRLPAVRPPRVPRPRGRARGRPEPPLPALHLPGAPLPRRDVRRADHDRRSRRDRRPRRGARRRRRPEGRRPPRRGHRPRRVGAHHAARRGRHRAHDLRRPHAAAPTTSTPPSTRPSPTAAPSRRTATASVPPC